MALKSLIYIFSLLILPICVSTQDTKIPALLQKIDFQNPDSTRIDAISTLGEIYIQVNLDSSNYYIKILEELAIKTNNLKAHALTHNLKSAYLIHKGKLDSAIEENQKALDIAEGLDDHTLLSKIYTVKAMAQHSRNNIEAAIQAFLDALKYAELAENHIRILMNHGNLGYIHIQSDNLRLAEYHFKKMAELTDTISDVRMKSFAIRNLGMLEAKKGNIKAAEEKFLEAIKYSTQRQDLYNIGNVRLQLGKLFFENKSYKKAKEQLDLSISLFDELGNVEHQVETYIAILKLNNTIKEYDETILQADKALLLLSQNESTDFKKQFYEELAIAHAEKGNYKQAYIYHKEYKIWADSVFSLQKVKKAFELESKHQLEKKEMSIQILSDQKIKDEAVIKQKSLTNVISILSLIMISLLSINLWSNYTRKKSDSDRLEIEVKERTKELETINYELKSSNDELERFAYISSHDLKEPLRNISGFSELTKRAIAKNDIAKANSNLEFIKNNIFQMDKLIEAVLDYSKLKMTHESEIVNLNEVLLEVKNSLSSLIKEKSANIQNNQLPSISGNQFQLFQLFKNIIENGIKYNQSEQVRVDINYTETASNYIFNIKDNGIGIDPKYHTEVFTMFKRLHTQSEFSGSGMGLAIVKKIVIKLNGLIKLNSDIGTGCEFIITLPK